MTMITNKIDSLLLWSKLTFKTRCYRKNFDLVTENENIITEYEGSVSELRLANRERPFIIGEFTFSIWNIELAKTLNINVYDILKAYALEDSYKELKQAVDNNEIDFYKHQKIIIIHSFIVRADYRKRGITEEFIEAMYRDFYNVQNAMIVLAKPFQYNSIDKDYYQNHKFVKMLGVLDDIERIPAHEYYSLKDLYDKNDVEFNEYKLFAIADRCGFSRIGDSHLFLFSPKEIETRMVEKMKLAKQLNIK